MKSVFTSKNSFSSHSDDLPYIEYEPVQVAALLTDKVEKVEEETKASNASGFDEAFDWLNDEYCKSVLKNEQPELVLSNY